MDKTIEAISARIRRVPSVANLIERYEAAKKGRASALATVRETRTENAASAALAPLAGAALGGVADTAIPFAVGPVGARAVLGLALTVYGWRAADVTIAGVGSGMLLPEAYNGGRRIGGMIRGA